MIKFICPKCGKEIDRYHDESLYNHYPCSTTAKGEYLGNKWEIRQNLQNGNY